MTDQRGGPLSTYLPTPNPIGPGVPKPIERPTLGQVYDAATTTSRADLPSAERDRLYEAYKPIVDELNQGRSWFRRYHNPGAGGANLETYLFNDDGNLVASAPGAEAQEDHLWRAIDTARLANPKAFPGVPATRDDFHAQILANAKTKLRGARDTIGRNESWAGTGAEIAAGVATSFRDPVNIAAMPIGGVGRSVATRIVTSALANMAVEAIEQPIVATQREKLGEKLTIGEAATNVAIAGVFGGVLQGAGELAAPLLGGAIGRGRALAAKARERIGWENMTSPEKVAVLSLERDADIAATSPFKPGAGTDAHVDRIERTVAGLKAGEGVPPPAPVKPRFDFNTWSNRVGGAENGGKWQGGSSSSSAYGMYQITRDTWLRYAEKARVKGVDDDATWGKRTNPTAQEAVFTALTRDNRDALARIGAPETYGNLYLMHFAGSGAGAKILKAAPGTPIECVLSQKAIAANPFLVGKSTGDVVAWAHAKMGETPNAGPVLSRSGFDEHDAGDAEWRAAQAEVEAAERQIGDANRADVDEAMPRSATDNDIPFDLDENGATRSGQQRDPFADLPDDMVDARPVRIDGSMDAEPVRPTLSQAEAADLEARGLGPASALSFVSKEGPPGVSFVNEGGDYATAIYRDQSGAARGIVRMPISDEARKISNEVSSYVVPELRRQGIATQLYDSIRANGFDVDGLSGTADLTPDGAAFVNARRARPADAPAPSSVPRRYQDWQSPNDELDTYWRYQAETPEGMQPVWAMRDASGAIVKWAPSKRAIARELDREFFPENFTVGQVEPSLRGAEAEPMPAPIAGFDNPDDIAATRQIDSMVHDLKMLVDEVPDMRVRVGDDGVDHPLADVLAELDADEAAIDAARKCM